MSTIKAVRAFLFAAILLLASLTLAACGGNGNPPSPLFTVSVTVVNLAGSGGGLVLQDNSNDTLPVNANGTFMFTDTVSSGSAYNITISAQPANPTQICGVVNGSGIANANVTVQVNCGHNEWAWTNGPDTVSGAGVYGNLGVPAATNNPGARQAPLTEVDASGTLWLFGGFGFDSTGARLPLNDLWKYSAGQWTWMGGSSVGNQIGNYGVLGTPASTNIPGARSSAVGWIDASGDFWLFGGLGLDSLGNQGTLNDLWKYSAGEWTWIGGSNLFDQQGTYNTQGVAAAPNVPPSRRGAISWADSAGHFWLFGGINFNVDDTNGLLNDLWRYSNGEWTWMSGSNLTNQHAVYGTQGMGAPGNVPGARVFSVSWIDASGNLWLFGGSGETSSGPSNELLNDLWKYSNGQWTWVSGSSGALQSGVYGTQGTPAPGNVPGARQNPVGWADTSGNFWVFGGNGPDSAGNQGLLNDLWKYSSGEWTWMAGANVINQNGIYGTQGALDPGNIPGARLSAVGWIDASGNLWLFGGYGVPATGTERDLNDLWMYMP
jgi:N-acetylneuraminic acid mutarotase